MKQSQRPSRQAGNVYLALAALLTFIGGAVLLSGDRNPDDADLQAYLVRTKSTPAASPTFYNPFSVVGTRDPFGKIKFTPIAQSRIFSKSVASKHAKVTFPEFTHSRVPDEQEYPDWEDLDKRKIEFQLARRELVAIQQELQNFYKTNKIWPESFKEAGVNFPGTQMRYVEKLLMHPRGQFLAFLSNRLGEDKLIRLTPEPPDSSGDIRWHCRTNVKNALLGSGKKRNCIYSSIVRSVRTGTDQSDS